MKQPIPPRSGKVTEFDRIEGLGAMIIEEPTGGMTFSIKLIPEVQPPRGRLTGKLLEFKPHKRSKN